MERIRIYAHRLKDAAKDSGMTERNAQIRKDLFAEVMVPEGRRRPLLDENGKQVTDADWNPKTYRPYKKNPVYLDRASTAALTEYFRKKP